MPNPAQPMVVAITGAGGNLGRKITAALIERVWCRRVICLDRRGLDDQLFVNPRIEAITTDLVAPRDAAWQRAVADADAVVHLAATDPSPGGSWTDAAASFDITMNLLGHVGHKPCRFVFASSNHAMGGYKEEEPGPGFIRMSTPPWPGTLMFDGEGYYRATAYGSAKLMGERAAIAMAEATGGVVTSVAMRIGWCLPAGRGPEHVTAGGSTKHGARVRRDPAEEGRDLVWFRQMWLSNRDFVAECEAALRADAAGWPAPGIVVNAVSANRGTPWNMEEARRWLGHVPRDDIWQILGLDPPRG